MSEDSKKQTLVYLTPALVERLDAQAKLSDRSRSWCIEHACDIWLRGLQRKREARSRNARKRLRERLGG